MEQLTQSMMNMLGRCGQQFEFRYVKGIKVAPGTPLLRGIATHTAAQENHKSIRSSGIHLTKDVLTDITAETFDNSVRDEGVWFSPGNQTNSATILSDEKDNAVRCTELYADVVAPEITKPILVEEKISVTVPGMSLPLMGTLDLVHETPFGSSQILDLKTGTKKYAGDYGENNMQVTMYSLLAETHFGVAPDFVFKVLLAQKTQSQVQEIKGTTDKESRRVLLTRAMFAEKQIKSGLFPPADTTNSWWCSKSWCGYFNMCPFVRNPVTISVGDKGER